MREGNYYDFEDNGEEYFPFKFLAGHEGLQFHEKAITLHFRADIVIRNVTEKASVLNLTGQHAGWLNQKKPAGGDHSDAFHNPYGTIITFDAW